MWDFWWTKWHWGGFSPSTSISHANLCSTKFSILKITPGGYNRPEVADMPSGLTLDCTHLDKKNNKKLSQQFFMF
jgi:hypothetical protein